MSSLGDWAKRGEPASASIVLQDDVKRNSHFLSLLPILLAGCGGGGSATFKPTILVNWPVRSRDVNAPSSALSLDITLSNGAEAIVNRPDVPTSSQNLYTLPIAVPAGRYTVSLRFYSQEDGSIGGGFPVATASGLAMISGASLSLGTYAITGNVVSAAILPGQSVPVGGTVIANAAAYDSSRDDLAVTPGGFLWSLVSSDGSMTLTPDGHVTATAAGTLTATVTVDGVVSPVQTITSYGAAPNANCTNSTYVPNYAQTIETSLDLNLAGKLRHWSSFPLTVSITPNAYADQNFANLVALAEASWASASSNQVTFLLVSPSQNPDITFTYEPSSAISNSGDGVVGSTKIYTAASNSSVLTHADIQITTDLDNNTQTLNVIAHELGHALGINGHSPVVQDLMFQYLTDDEGPTADDINTLYTAYCGSFSRVSSAIRAPRPARSPSPIVITDPRKQ